MTWIAMGRGGAVGAMARHAVNHVVHAHWTFVIVRTQSAAMRWCCGRLGAVRLGYRLTS